MECLPVTEVPTGPQWVYEIKLDGYRLEAVKAKRETLLYSRRRNLLNPKFPYIAAALSELAPGTVLDGELVALDEHGSSNFGLLQSFRSAQQQIHYYAFDVLVHRGRSLLEHPLRERQALLGQILPRNEHVSLSAVEDSQRRLLAFVRRHGLEGVIAKRRDSPYEPGKRSGLWCKHRLNQGQEFVVGGYTRGGSPFDAIIIGFYQGRELVYAARVRAGFVPATRRALFEQLRGLETPRCPFVNLPETTPGRWGQGLTAERMKECVWLKPRIVVQIEFREWTSATHLRHTRFVGLRADKEPGQVIKERA
jgi:bifunctional non-homologous end joining protein LigD